MLGQFLTPAPIGEFMASLFDTPPSAVRLLDAGAGAGALTEAFVQRICKEGLGVRSIHTTAFEIDSVILPALRKTMENCRALCCTKRIVFSFSIEDRDFIREMSEKLSDGLFATVRPQFDVAIANPPYKKINTDSPERLALRSIGLETSNLYTGFIGVISRLLVSGGQLVAITPRSFCNGPYFRLFREDFLSSMELKRLHVFDSRKAAFRDDSVLQENVIFHALKRGKTPTEITVSSSSGETGAPVVETCLPFTKIVCPGDSEKFIHIPVNAHHATAKASMDVLPATLASLGLTISTGRVVDFRLKDALRMAPIPGTVPLLYPCHFNGGTVHWPKLKARKPNAILDTEETRRWLVPSGFYLLTKRFTSKEERRRLVACLFDPKDVDAEWLGFENHLNYFHDNGKGLEKRLAFGLFAYLNSTVIDQYFRTFSGHTQVNATDLRNLPYPSRLALQAMGAEMTRLDLNQEDIDALVVKYIHASRQTKQQSNSQKTTPCRSN